jgi:hypothetical protein
VPLVPFDCPLCKAVVYAPAGAEVAHVCRKAKPRPKFTKYKRREE